MKLKLLSITALLIAVGVATPVRADEVRQTNEQQTVQSSGDQYQAPRRRPCGPKDGGTRCTIRGGGKLS
jgi:hypothetical protein